MPHVQILIVIKCLGGFDVIGGRWWEREKNKGEEMWKMEKKVKWMQTVCKCWWGGMLVCAFELLGLELLVCGCPTRQSKRRMRRGRKMGDVLEGVVIYKWKNRERKIKKAKQKQGKSKDQKLLLLLSGGDGVRLLFLARGRRDLVRVFGWECVRDKKRAPFDNSDGCLLYMLCLKMEENGVCLCA